LLGIGACLAVARLAAQEPDPSAGGRGRTPEPTALPLWTRPDARAREDLGAVTRANSRAVILVGHPQAGLGTAWVLSRQHRLLVTNAHVADLIGSKGKMLAVVNGTDQVHQVKRVWYHPGVRRQLPGGKLSIRAECPSDGPVEPFSPDLAVLELTPDGPALPAELPMATAEELKTLFAQTVGMMGFPGHSTSWPGLGEKAQATYHDGVVSRLTNFRLSVNVPEEELQFVQTTLANWFGFSGSPLYLANGHVVAVNNSSRSAEKKGLKTQISHAVRVDCLWELLVHHGLDGKVPVPVTKSRLRIDRWLKPEAAGDHFRRAVKLVDEAASLINYQQKFRAGVDKCDEAILLFPEYPLSYQVRAAGLNNCYFYNRPGKQEALALLEQARKDAKLYFDKMGSDVRAVEGAATTALNWAALTRDRALIRKAVDDLDKVLSSGNLPAAPRAQLHSLRGMSHFNLGDKARAREDYNESLRLDPTNDVLYDNRARFWEAMRRDDLADEDRAKARALRKQHTQKPKTIED
jgi:tetratricopeptide (TPR) repeat protein